MKRKGVSEVVTAILLVLLAVAAVIIVWAVVKGFITTTAGGAASGCASIDLSITSVDRVANTTTVKRNPNLAGTAELAKIKFVFENATGSKTATEDSTLLELGSNIFSFDASEVAVGYNKVSAYPVVTSESGEKLCDKPAVWNA